MKLKSTIAAFFLMSAIYGCVSTKGISDSSNKKQEPYKFMFAGPPSEATVALKRLLFENGFTIANDDPQAGILITQPKKLNEDERYDAGFAMAMFGSRIQQQQGVVRVLLDTTGTSTICSISCILSIDATISRSAFKEDKLNTDETVLPQGHPLPMKLKAAIVKLPRFTDVTPK